MNVRQTLTTSNFLSEPRFSSDGIEMSLSESRFYLNKMVLSQCLELITLSVTHTVAQHMLDDAQLLIRNLVGDEADLLVNYCKVFAELIEIEYEPVE